MNAKLKCGHRGYISLLSSHRPPAPTPVLPPLILVWDFVVGNSAAPRHNIIILFCKFNNNKFLGREKKKKI